MKTLPTVVRSFWISALLSTSAASAVSADTATVAVPTSVELNHGWLLQSADQVTGSGADISGPTYVPTGWRNATVPGSVLTSLVDDGVFPEPLYGENNRPDRIPESLNQTPYWYYTKVTVPSGYAGRRIWLRFEGINYTAEVWVNGHDTGAIRGAFARGAFDITDDVTPGTTAAVAVEVSPQPHPGTPHEHTQALGTGRNGGLTAADGPTFLATIGWDWMPAIRDRDTGIWQTVTLSSSGPVLIENPDITSELPLPRTDSAYLTVEATLRNVSATGQTGILIGSSASGIAFSVPVILAAGESKTITVTPATAAGLHVDNPRLWWPNGYGAPNLYTLHLTFTPIGGAVSDASDTTFGIRSITYAQPGSDILSLSVNGVPVFCKGGDWGMDEAMKRIGPKRLEAQIRMHQLANYTMIRNWVGQSTSDDFYRFCDKYGILLWDEFFQPNPSDGPDPYDPTLYLDNVREKLLRYRSHPCIALWCARNEGTSTALLDSGISHLVSDLDGHRLYQASSGGGRGVQSGGPYSWRPPQSYYNYDEAFKTEIGSVSIPTLEGLHAMMPASDWGEMNDDWAEHDLLRGAQRGDRYPLMMSDRYGWVCDTVDFVRKAQLMNYEAYRAMYEAREAYLFAPETGVLTWMSNPAQPSMVWQIYSHDLEPLSSLYGVRKACEPVHIEMNQASGHVMVINNTATRTSMLTATSAVYALNGTQLASHSDQLAAAPSAATDLGAIAVADGMTSVHFVRLTLTDAAGHIVSDNFYWRGPSGHEDDLADLDKLPMVTLQGHAVRHDTGSVAHVEITLGNPTRSIALMAHVQLRKSGGAERVLPVYYSDNYISILPGETKVISAEADLADIGPGAPCVAVDGWNVTVADRPAAAGLHVIANPAAMPSAAPHPLNINCGGAWVGDFGTDTDVVGGAGAGAFPFRPGFRPRPAQPGSPALGPAPPVAQRLPGLPPPANTPPTSTSTIVTSFGPVDTSAPHAAPGTVYESARQGECSYAIPVTPGQSYLVRLHFAENSMDHAGARLFDVEINGTRALTDFDIFATAGAQRRAVVQDLSNITPDPNGVITIHLLKGSVDNPIICGIQVIPQSKYMRTGDLSVGVQYWSADPAWTRSGD